MGYDRIWSKTGTKGLTLCFDGRIRGLRCNAQEQFQEVVKLCRVLNQYVGLQKADDFIMLANAGQNDKNDK